MIVLNEDRRVVDNIGKDFGPLQKAHFYFVGWFF